MTEIMNEMERIYDVCKGVDGVYRDPLDTEAVIICNKGKVMKLPKKLFENFDKVQRTNKVNLKK